MYTAAPNQGERFYLRLLLLHVPGATSFQDLRTVDDVIFDTFRGAALARELLEDDTVWVKCMEEAATVQMPAALRNLFATLLEFCELKDPSAVWDQYKELMSEDYTRDNRHTVDAGIFFAYEDIEEALHGPKRSLPLDFHIPRPPQPANPHRNIAGVDYVALRETGQAMLVSLNANQRLAADDILAAVYFESDQRCFFIDGPGGTGKTYLYNCLSSILEATTAGPDPKTTINVAWTGIAATLLPHGATVHSTFKIPLTLDERSRMGLSGQSKQANAIRYADVIIWDEAPMASKQVLEMIDQGLRDLTQIDEPFGGKIVVLGGDFRQVLPIVPRASRGEEIAASIKNSGLWPLFKIYKLEQNVRVNEHQVEFKNWLLELGEGRLPQENGEIEVPPQFHTGDVVKAVFGERIDVTDIASLQSKVILCTTNETTTYLNLKVRMIQRHQLLFSCNFILNLLQVLELIPGDRKTYTTVDEANRDDNEDAIMFPEEYLHSLMPTGLPPHRLTLKVGCIVTLLRNLNIKRGLCNGVRLVVRRMLDHVLDCELLTGPNAGTRVLIPQIKLKPAADGSNVPFTRRQFPVRLAFAMTINKAQGQTFDCVGVYLKDCPVFAHGQLYVAFSRVTSSLNLKVQLSSNCHTTKNIVYHEILQ